MKKDKNARKPARKGPKRARPNGPGVLDLPTAERVAERTAKAMRLRKAGVSYEEIARQLGVDRSVIIRDIQAALRDLYQENAKELLTLEIERLNMVMFGSWPAALKGDPKAVQAVLGCIDRRVKLGGIDSGPPKERDDVVDRPMRIEIVYSPGVASSTEPVAAEPVEPEPPSA